MSWKFSTNQKFNKKNNNKNKRKYRIKDEEKVSIFIGE